MLSNGSKYNDNSESVKFRSKETFLKDFEAASNELNLGHVVTDEFITGWNTQRGNSAVWIFEKNQTNFYNPCGRIYRKKTGKDIVDNDTRRSIYKCSQCVKIYDKLAKYAGNERIPNDSSTVVFKGLKVVKEATKHYEDCVPETLKDRNGINARLKASKEVADGITNCLESYKKFDSECECFSSKMGWEFGESKPKLGIFSQSIGNTLRTRKSRAASRASVSSNDKNKKRTDTESNNIPFINDQYSNLYTLTMVNHYIKTGDNPELTELRKKASFNTEELAIFLAGGKDKLDKKRRIHAFVESKDELKDSKPLSFMTRSELMENEHRKKYHMMQFVSEIADASSLEDMYFYNDAVHNQDGHPFSLHGGMFIPCLEAQADDEQRRIWLAKANNYEINGTYAQTEMGHGTNLRKLETTATFDYDKDEFIINTPTITATKWWPGNLGKNANVCIVAAQTWIKGKCYGTNNFIVQLRDFETHEPLPGITVGDIGPKFGYQQNDNGFCKFDNVRIPRRNMLMKHVKVDREGNFTKPVHDKISYTTMLYVRAVIVTVLAEGLGKAVTIAVRYSVIRKQGEIDDPKKEVSVLDYTTQQYRLLPQVARTVAYLCLGKVLTKLYFDLLGELNSGNASYMTDLHVLLCGIKAVVTHEVALGIEQCRMSCGGHGYSQASGFPYIYGAYVCACTYEGENMVMLLQCAGGLMKSVNLVVSGKSHELTDTLKYLGEQSKSKSTICGDNVKIHEYIECLEVNAKKQIFDGFEQFSEFVMKGMNKRKAINECAIPLTKAARRHTKLYIAKAFSESVLKLKNGSLKNILLKVVELYLAYEVMESPAGMILEGFIDNSQLTIISKRIKTILSELKDDSLSIVDSLDITDRQLNSVLGRRDGHVYENLLKWAQASELNKTNVLPSHHKYMGKLFKSRKAVSSSKL
uniref:acyl-CoA oxidase n=1 Tax=Parastrongyloides trichosuri TaxID=131310 RepID=A0A0N4Z459_PARTI